MRGTMRAALAALVLTTAAHAADAGTVRYYSRQKLVGLGAAYTYAPEYGDFGACSGGTQSATVSACRRSDGRYVDNSLCSPQTISQNCVAHPNCSALIGQVVANTGPYSPAVTTQIGTASSAADAVALCNQQTVDGTCTWNVGDSTDTGFVSHGVYYTNTVGLNSTSSPNIMSNRCYIQ